MRGELALAEHQTTSALLNYEQAMVLDPTSSEAMQGLIQVYGEGKITRPMLLRMESFAASDRNLSGLMELTGRLFAEHGWTSDAIRCLRRASEMDKERSSAAEEVAKLLARHGQLDRSSRFSHQGARVLHPAGGSECRPQTRFGRGGAQLRSGGARRRQQRISANNLAWIYARQGRELDRALALAMHACELAPEDPAVLDTLGVVYLARREYSRAVGVLELARTLAESRGQSERSRAGGDEASFVGGLSAGRANRAGFLLADYRKSSP